MPEGTGTQPFASREVVPVRILLSAGFRVEGSVYISAEPNRFSDAWEELMRDPRAFVAVTAAATRSTADGTFEETDELLLVRKSDIVAIRPSNRE